MREIRLGTVGEIVTGVEAGRFVEVLDDWSGSGGFLIFTYENRDRSGETFDSWVENIIDVERYFDESGWEIAWADE